MGVLQRFERRVERLVSGVFARTFKSEVQPVEIASALQRECDAKAAIVARGRTMVPNAFVVELGASDYDRLSVYAEPLGAELSDMVREHAAEQAYTFVGPVQVDFEQAEDLGTGMFRVRSTAVAGASRGQDRQRGASGVTGRQGPDARPGPSGWPPGRTSDGDEPGPPYLEVDGARFPLTAPVTVLGRGADVDVRIEDPGISRRHAEVRVRRGGRRRDVPDDRGGFDVSIVDLGSTNGIVLGGRRVPRADLRDGSEVMLGSTRVVLHVDDR